jgi:hypothetical protein
MIEIGQNLNHALAGLAMFSLMFFAIYRVTRK